MWGRGAYALGAGTPDVAVALFIGMIACGVFTRLLYPVLERRLRLDRLPWVVFGSLLGGMALSLVFVSPLFYHPPLMHSLGRASGH